MRARRDGLLEVKGMERETRLDGETVFVGRLLRVERDRVRTVDGRESVREVVRHPGAATVVAVDDDDRLVLVRQPRYAVGDALLELPAGTLEAGEDPRACAERELAEETGMKARRWRRLGALWMSPGWARERLHVFLASGLARDPEDPPPDPGEVVEVERVPLREVSEMVRRGGITNGATVAALLLAQLHGELGHWW